MKPDQWARIKPIFAEAAEQPAAERAAFIRSRCNGDDLLVAEIESLLGAHDQAGPFIEGLPDVTTTSAHDNEGPDKMIGRLLGAYELVREIGRGGMGSVYLATRADEQFRKLVAVKLIKADLDNESITRRFRNERQILASLDHPNIARLLDGGTTEEGSPYFVMEYIEGKPIRDYCDAHRLSTDRRLRLFRDVCSAVHYSHQNLVVHRDLKPSNILVTEDGTVKLLDFGIAKLIGASASFGEASLATSRVMTPEYASPEQVRGETITTSSDTYSLGVMLYELLCGHRPYRVATTSPLDMIRAICEEEPERPSTAVGRTETTNTSAGETSVTPEAVSRARDSQPDKLRRQLEGDLDNIVLKAMRKEPQRRYSSVEQFSEDLRRYLDGLPVLARKDTFSYRSGKFVRRNKLGVSAAAIIVLLLTLGVAGIARQTVIANRQRARAEKRFNEVRELAHSFMFTFHDAIKNLAGATAARQLVVNESLEYLNSLADEASDDPSLQRELGEAYHKLAEIQGVPGASNLGDKAGAAESLRKAIAIRESLVASRAADVEDRVSLSESYSRLSSVLSGPESLESALKGQAILESLLAADPNNERLLMAAGSSYQSVGQYLSGSGDYAGAIANYRKMQTIYQTLAESSTANVTNRHDLALACKKVGAVLIVTGDLAAATENYNRALEIERALIASHPDNATMRLDMSYTLSDLALIHRKSKDYPGALKFGRESMAIREELCAADPKDQRSRSALAAIYTRVGNILLESEDFEGAFQYLKKSLEIKEASISESSPADKASISEDYCSIGETHAAAAVSPKLPPSERRRHWQDARSAFQRALDMNRDLFKQGVHISADCTPDQLTRQIARCEAELRKR
jgi:eukaryotic-like serine/threonine-protein kinase